MRKDDILLNEAYRKVHTDDLQQLDELFGNVADARLKGVGATIGGLKNRVVGNIQKGCCGQTIRKVRFEFFRRADNEWRKTYAT